MRDADVKAQAVLCKRLNPFDELGAQAEFGVRLKLNDSSDALDQRNTGEAFEIRTGSVANLQRCPCHDPLNAWVVLRQPRCPRRFREELRKIGFGLNEDHAL